MVETNGVIMQYFEWYCPADGSLWGQVQDQARELAAKGITALWLPPVYKGTSSSDVGYSTYDLFDLGEFDQKGTIRTKYGTKEELIAAVKASRAAGLQVYLDTVFNHKNGGDATETVWATPVASDNRNWELGAAREISIWSKFTFPGRGDRYSAMKWDARCFDSVNHNANDPDDRAIYRLSPKTFESKMSHRYGNYDFLMACDLDTNHPEVRQELVHWGQWIQDTLGTDGFRLDAVKHIRSSFFNEWLDAVRRHCPHRKLFAVGEYWENDVEALHRYLAATEGRMSLFDVPLHYNFHQASRSGSAYDLRTILDHTLMQQQPTLAVTFVDNHDSQPLQALESPVEAWFKPLAYAIILLRREGYPCVFYGDYYGAEYTDRGRDGHQHTVSLSKHNWLLDKFLYARRRFGWGPQYDYFSGSNTIGWTRLGDATHPLSMAVVLSNGGPSSLWMETGQSNATFYDLTDHVKELVYTNEWGWGEFRCAGGSVSVWIQQA
ncbi:MAG: alpha-amylase [Limnothrix sp.]|nr:alpha-amylase [Limnothrix sp.]